MRPAAIAQADYLLPPQEVQFLRHNGAQTVSCAKAATAVQPKHKHLGNNNTGTLVKQERSRTRVQKRYRETREQNVVHAKHKCAGTTMKYNNRLV